jgi:CBS domain-containing protein
MTRDVVCVREDMSLEALRALLLERGIGAAPVVDEEGMPVGVITKTDLVRALGELDAPIDVERPLRTRADNGIDYALPAGFHMEPLPRATARELMMPFVFALPMDTSVAQAAAFMAARAVHHVIIVDDLGEVVGILSTLDLARWLAAETGYVASAEADLKNRGSRRGRA